MSQVNTALASGHFKNDGVVQLSLDFCRALAIECLENKLGLSWERMDNLIELVEYLYISLERKLQWNTMTACEIEAKKNKK